MKKPRISLVVDLYLLNTGDVGFEAINECADDGKVLVLNEIVFTGDITANVTFVTVQSCQMRVALDPTCTCKCVYRGSYTSGH